MKIVPGNEDRLHSIAQTDETQPSQQCAEAQIDGDNHECIAVVGQEYVRDSRQAATREVHHLRVQDVLAEEQLLGVEDDVSQPCPAVDSVTLELVHVGRELNTQVVSRRDQRPRDHVFEPTASTDRESVQGGGVAGESRADVHQPSGVSLVCRDDGEPRQPAEVDVVAHHYMLAVDGER